MLFARSECDRSSHVIFTSANIKWECSSVCDFLWIFRMHFSCRLFAFSLTVQYDPSFNWNVDWKISSNINAENFSKMGMILLLFLCCTHLRYIEKGRFHGTVSAYLQLIYVYSTQIKISRKMFKWKLKDFTRARECCMLHAAYLIRNRMMQLSNQSSNIIQFM